MATTQTRPGGKPEPEKQNSTQPSGILAPLDRYQRQHPWLAIPLATIKKAGNDNASNLAGALTFYGFFAIFPLLLVFVTILGFVLAGDHSALVSVRTSVVGQFPVIGQTVSDKGLSGSVPALVIGVLLTFWSGLGVTGTVRHAMDVVWDVPKKSRAGFLTSKLHGAGLLLLLGTMFAVAAGASGIVMGGLGGPLLFIAGIALSIVLNFGLFMFSFKLLSSAKLSWRTLAPGSALAAVIWAILQLAGGTYIDHIKSSDSAYGTFALVLGILTWLHLGAQMTLYCAELNTVLAERMWPWPLSGDATPPVPLSKREHRSVPVKDGQIDADRYIAGGSPPLGDATRSTPSGR